MDKTFRRSDVDDILGVSDLMSLVELQKFLADELAGSTDGTEDFSRAFLPLTDGLGLENPPKRDVAQPRMQPIKMEAKLDPTDIFPDEPMPEKKPSTPKQLDSVFDGPDSRAEPPTETKAQAIHRAATESAARESIAPLYEDTEVTQEPPPMPQASFLRRGLAGAADFFFVIMLWGIALALTSINMGGTAEGLLAHLPKAFANGTFLRDALLEYTALWLCYFVITVGFGSATVGMWAWGMRVTPVDEEGRWVKKLFRAFLSFITVAPILPVIVLVLRSRGRNLIDLLSGTHVYRTAL